MFTISIVNRKGGSGKTTTAVNLACQLAMHYSNKQVLLIDLDPQNHAKVGLGEIKKTTSLGIHKIFSHAHNTHTGLIQKTRWPNLSFIPADEEAMENNNGATFHLLKHFINSAFIKKQFDFVILDTPPNHGMFLINAIVASDAMVVSFIPQTLDHLGVTQVMKLILRHSFKNIKVAFLPTMVKSRVRHHNKILSQLVREYGNTSLLKGIHTNIQLTEAFQKGVPIQYYAPKSRGAFDYHMLLNELKLIWPEDLPEATEQKSLIRPKKTSLHLSTSNRKKNVIPFKEKQCYN